MSKSRFKIRYLMAAEDDLYGIADYIAKDNPRAADKMIDRFEQAIGRLELSPFAGKAPDDDELKAHSHEVTVAVNSSCFFSALHLIYHFRFIQSGRFGKSGYQPLFLF